MLQDDRRILTASGDQTLGLWDTSRAACLGVFKGHHGSVKCVRPKPDCPDVFASGTLQWPPPVLYALPADNRGMAPTVPVSIVTNHNNHNNATTTTTTMTNDMVIMVTETVLVIGLTAHS